MPAFSIASSASLAIFADFSAAAVGSLLGGVVGDVVGTEPLGGAGGIIGGAVCALVVSVLALIVASSLFWVTYFLGTYL